jgi:DNA-binding NarL/FixJ family response regulator
MKILIVDDHALFRAGLRMLLTAISPAAICLEAGTVNDAMACVAEHPDLQLCLLDLSLRHESGDGMIERIKLSAPRVAVVVVSAAEDPTLIRACIDAGAMSFIPKSAPPDVLTKALQHVLSGAVYLPAQVVPAADASERHPTLSPRQMQVLQCLSRGLPTKLIARELALSEHTVKEYIALVFQAVGARNRTEAVIKAGYLRLRFDADRER